ncbi:MAG: ribonuclease III [Candidatus Margulisbacteria bacterium]|nr:ribonuclease III [Candidatus Margulisiibacteriota bacterium]
MLNHQRIEHLRTLEKILNIYFDQLSLLSQALTHSSYTYEGNLPDKFSNERLEFLGDSILKFVITEYLYKQYPDQNEGDLAQRQAIMVSDATLAQKALEISLGNYLLLGKGEQKNLGATNESNLANALEALFGAFYLDQGMDATRAFILNILHTVLSKNFSEEDLKDHKTRLQEYTQSQGLGLPEYQLLKEAGPDHAKKFTVKTILLTHKKELIGIGMGSSKKSAESAAAQDLLQKLGKDIK